MKTLTKIALAGLMASSAFAAPGLTVSGTDLMYNGKKIFFSGTNLAWTDYNSDVGDAPLDENAWRKAVEGTRAAGGNAIRWWLFNNMSQSPAINQTTHLVSGLKANTIANMKKALDIAEEYGVMVSMCLFSHNLMEPNQWGIYNEKLDFTANQNLFTDEGTKAFIDNALIPVIKEIGNHNALMTWEVFNEPEGMTSVGWTTKKLDKAVLQKFTNKVAAAIHTENPELLVSTGSVNIQYQEWWNDANLVAAGGEAKGTLDFFQTHYYPYYQSDDVSPFVNTAAAMQAKYKYDAKPMIIGEFPASGWSGNTYTPSMAAKTQVSTENAYKFAYESGYAGALAWQYIGDKAEMDDKVIYTYTIDPALDGMKALAATGANEYIKIKDVEIEPSEGNGRMHVTYGGDNAQIEYQKSFDLSKAKTLTFSAENNGASEASLDLIFKIGSDWKWTEVKGSCKVAAEAKTTCSYDISGITGRNQVVSIIVANYAKGYTGTIAYDNFVAGSQILFDFNKDKYDAFSRSFNNTEEMIPSIKISFDGTEEAVPGKDEAGSDSKPGSSNSNGNAVPNSSNSNTTALFTNNVISSGIAVQGNSIMLSTSAMKDVSVDVFSMMGKHVATLHRGSISAGTHAFGLGNMARGNYIVRVKGAGINASQQIVVK